MQYYKLTDDINFNEVIKERNGKEYIYRFGIERWVCTGIMTRYRCPNDIVYNEYVEISEDEAMKLIGENREKMNQLLELAIKVATKAHKGQKDKGGNPYILHPKAVADSLEETEHKVVAYLHDTVEDTSITFDDLIKMGFPPRIVDSIRVLTKEKGVKYEDYIMGVRKDSNAWYVKVADLIHNMDISRISNPTEKDYKRVKKYENALKYLGY